MKLPEYVEICPWCEGKGEYEQTYNAGCGMGMYRSMGRCDGCQHKKNSMKGLGYRMKNGKPVPDSIINQISIMNTPKYCKGCSIYKDSDFSCNYECLTFDGICENNNAI